MHKCQLFAIFVLGEFFFWGLYKVEEMGGFQRWVEGERHGDGMTTYDMFWRMDVLLAPCCSSNPIEGRGAFSRSTSVLYL